jgi:cell division transport system ATP-binding protein
MKDASSAIIRMFHVHKRYGSHIALADINLDIEKNELLLISGASGAGKSTLLKLLYMGEPASEGQIIVDGMNLSRISHAKTPFLRRKFGIIFQDYKLIHGKTVFENIALVLEVAGNKPSYIHKKVKSVLRMVGMEDKIGSFPPSLSGGEQQRVAVARAIAGSPDIILADEPTGSLDPGSAEIIIDLLTTLNTQGVTVIIATHDQSIINKTKGRVCYLENGRIPPQAAEIEKKPAITI